LYSTVEDIKRAMKKLSVRVTDEEIQSYIEKADSLIDAMLGEVYNVPLFPVPVLIKYISVDLAVFFLSEDLYTSQQPNMDAYQEKRYTRAMEMLNQIVLGDLIVVGNTPKNETGYATTNDEQIFTYEDPEW
jgi:phage gp36-like protein